MVASVNVSIMDGDDINVRMLSATLPLPHKAQLRVCEAKMRQAKEREENHLITWYWGSQNRGRSIEQHAEAITSHLVSSHQLPQSKTDINIQLSRSRVWNLKFEIRV
mmetsp:Transcript_7198/g.19507  ORF Transcript_7198/g.19507 Transcript_7198/m.19507 type:complete len:107 (-) Transcript_7198:1243-1563(-)